MRIGLLNFPINDVGGIASWTDNFWEGLCQAGYEDVGHIYLANQTRFGCKEDKYVHKRRYSLLPGEFLSLLPEAIDQTIQDLNDAFDVFVFVHPSPHPTKAQMSHRGPANWQRLYHELEGKKVVVFHDEKWRKTNDWMADVQGTCDLAVAAQHRFLPSVEDWADGGKSYWDYFPMPEMEPSPAWDGSRNIGVVFTQWIQWKNHLKFLPLLPDIKIPFSLFGGGIIYHNAKADGMFDEFGVHDCTTDGEDAPHGCVHEYHGFVPYPKMMESLRRARLAIDLSTRGYTNMSHWEPLWQGTPNFVEERVLADEFCKLPVELCESYSLDESLPDRINSFQPDLDKLIEGQKWMADRCSCQVVAERIINAIPA